MLGPVFSSLPLALLIVTPRLHEKVLYLRTIGAGVIAIAVWLLCVASFGVVVVAESLLAEVAKISVD